MPTPTPAAEADAAVLAAVTAAVNEVGPQPGPLLEVLHAVQHRLGCVPEAAVQPIATALNLSRAEVHGTITFYHHFRRTPPGRHIVQVCRAEACLAMRGDAVASAAEQCLGVSISHGAATTADGAVTLEPIFCLGLCAQSPAALVDGEPRVRLTPDSIQALCQGLRVQGGQS